MADTTDIVCPENISTYTDINSCVSIISGGLEISDPGNIIVSLFWSMTGATIDNSPVSGINQISSYSFNEGTTVVTYQGKDRYNNSIFCTFTVTVADNQVPRLETPFEDITVEADPGDCNAHVYWPDPVVSDNCISSDQILITANYNSGNSFPVGTTEVIYLISDGVEFNDETYQFTVTVADEEPPEIYAPEAVLVDCSEAVPDAFTSWQQFSNAGGMAFDNCNIDYTSFKYIGQKSSGINCPYTITRTYSIADDYGNVGKVEHVVNVGEEKVVVDEPEIILKSGMADYTAVSGNWSDPATWGGTVPTTTDNVIIPNGVTVVVDVAANCQNITIESGGELNHGTTLATTLQINGNWTNNGTYDGGTNGVVEFTGTVAASINGTTNFEGLIINIGSLLTTLTISGDVTVLSSGQLTMISGLVTIPGSGSFVVNPSSGLDIQEDAGFDVTGGTLTTGDFTITNEGLIRVAAGSTVNFGNDSGNEVHTQVDGAFIVTGGDVNIAGRLYNSASGTLPVLGLTAGITVSGGTITLCTEGNGLSTTGSLHVTATGTFDFSGGAIVFQNPSTAATELDLGLLGGGIKNTTGGTFQFGNASTPPGSSFNISSDIPLDHVTSSANADLVLESNILVNDLSLNNATTINLNGNALQQTIIGLTTYTFPIDDGSGNSIPVIITLNSGTIGAGAYLEVSSAGSIHPNNANSAHYLNRYWTLTVSGVTSPSYDVSANYSAGDIANAAATNLLVGNYSLGWSEIAGSNVSGTLISFSSTSPGLSFSVLQDPTVVITNTSDPEVICDGSTVTLSANATGDPTITYLWTSSPSTTISPNNTTSVNVMPPSSPSNSITNYTYTITVTDGNGFTASDNIGVTVNPIPTVAATPATQQICPGGTITQIDITNPNNVAGTTFSWTRDNTTILTGIATTGTGNTITGLLNSSNPGVLETTIFTITATANGCSSQTTVDVVVGDNVNPIAICQPYTVQLDAAGTATITANDIDNGSNDACGIQSLAASQTSFGCTDIGTNTVILTVTDINGNASTCNSTVTVEDNVAPTAVCQNITVQLDAAGNVTIAEDAVDNGSGDACGGLINFDTDINSFDCSDIGANPVVLTVTDANGNSSTCSATVTVEDNVNPTAACQDIAVQLDAAGNASIVAADVDNGSSDACGISSMTVSPNTFNCGNVGSNAVTLTVTDNNGNTNTCTATVTVEDNVAPTAVCQNITVQLDAAGNASIVAADVDNGSSDACGISSMTVSPNTFNCGNVGANAVTLTVTDNNGNTNTCTATVTVEDNVAPTAVCQNITVQLDGTGNVTIAEDAVDNGSGDACGGLINFDTDITSFDCSDVGANPVVLTVTDANGNSSTCSATVTVEDNISPILTCPGDITVSAPLGACETVVTYTVPTVSSGTDNCSVASVTRIAGLGSGATFPVGTTTETYEVTDVNGNTSTCSFDITVTDDEDPQITYCSGNIDVDNDPGDCSASIAIPDAEFSDNCAVQLSWQLSGDMNDSGNGQIGTYTFDVGTTQLTYTATDASGNTDVCITTITVADAEGPEFTDCPSSNTITVYADPGTCSANVSWTEPTKPAKDNCTVNKNKITMERVPDIAPGSSFTVGTTVIEYIARDEAGIESVCAIEITVLDGENPEIANCPANKVVSSDAGECYAIVSWTEPDASDNCNTSIEMSWSSNYAPADTFYIGTTAVEYIVSDTSGNESTCSFNISVIDNENPVITSFPSDTVVNNDAGECYATVPWTAPAATDNCTDPGSLTWTSTHAPNSTFDIGVTTVTYTVSDAGGNSVHSSFTITVNDAEPAILTAPDNITVSATANQCNASVTVPFAVFTDNCPAQSLMANSYNGGGRNASDVYPVGTTEVIYTITDFNGTILRDTTLVTVEDNQDPVLSCPSAITVNAESGVCTANVSVIANASDNCSEVTITNDVFPAGGNDASGVYTVGTTTVTFIATDTSGNSVSCTVDVTVLDNEDPLINCPANISQSVDAGGCDAFVSVPLPVTSDNCAIDTVYNDFNSNGDDASDTYSIGTTTVIFTAIDASGNATTCPVNITVIDSIAPVISCPGDITQTADPGDCEASVSGLVVTFTDNCNGGVITNNFNTGGADASGVYPVGITNVLFTVTDAAGNTDTCSVNVIITDDEAPVPDLATLPTVNGDVCSVTEIVNNPTATDNCYGVILGETDSATTFTAVGDYVIWWYYVAGDDTTWQAQNVHIYSEGAPDPDMPNLPTITGECTVTVSATPTATSKCNEVITGVTNDPLTYSTQGTHVVTWMYATASDTTYQTQSVIVKDITAPSILCPSPGVFYSDPGVCEATIVLDTASATDICLPVTISNNYTAGGSDASGVYPVGITTVTFTATDSVGNYNTCTAQVTVVDTQAPVLTCPGDLTVVANSSGGCDANVSNLLATATDNCNVANISNSFNGGGANAGGIYPLGTTNVTFYAYDAEGNVDSCTMNVTVTDTVAPQINCPANVQVPSDPGECYAIVSLSDVTTLGDCSDVIITNDYNNGGANASDTFFLGTTTITFSVSDTAGNTGNSCSFDITVYDDEAPVPVASTLELITSECAVTPEIPIAIDNCNDTIWGTTPVSFPIRATRDITWTFIDSAGNYSTENQSIIIDDYIDPQWYSDTLFGEGNAINLDCKGDTSILANGIPEAYDNCGYVRVTHSDEFDYAIGAACANNYTIIRTWTAIDSTGNTSSRKQYLNVFDNTPPTVSCQSFTVPTADDIFDPELLQGISFEDDCGIDTVVIYDEWYVFSEDGVVGFCPDTVFREYRVYDQCGKYSSCVQTIAVENLEDCALCMDTVQRFLVDFNDAPDSVWVATDEVEKRHGYCCDDIDFGDEWGCIAFNVYLDENAVGLILDGRAPWPSGESEYYRIDCIDSLSLDGVICLEGGRFYTVTFCKPGEDRPEYRITSISGAIVPDSLTTRADVDCYGDLEVGGLEPGTIEWTVSYPVGADTLIRYLSDPLSANPTFTPDSLTPALIKYQVCGVVAGAYECEPGEPIYDCAEVVVNVLPPININIDQDLTAICEDYIPPITASVPFEDPGLTYVFAWYEGPDITGTLLSNDRTYQPTSFGTYTVLVSEPFSGVGCSSDQYSFTISPDTLGPAVFYTPDTLFLDCSSSSFNTEIGLWLLKARAYEIIDGDSVSVEVTHDYTSFTPSCGHIQVVRFYAYDVCGNESKDSAYIVIQDDIAPVIDIEASDQIVDCNTLDNNNHPDYIAWLENYGGAYATDDCDHPDSLIWTNNAALQTWEGDGARDSITVTFTVTDECGNTDETTATFVVIDDQPPIIICPADVEDIIAPDNCSMTPSFPDTVSATDICSNPVLTWEMTGATVGSGTGQVTGEIFNVGYTKVHYTATDGAGLTDTCSFTVTVKKLSIPPAVITCPPDFVSVTVAAGDCDAQVSLPAPTISDPCSTAVYTITNNYTGTSTIANETFPVGTTTVEWTVVDTFGNDTICYVDVEVIGVELPSIICPPSVSGTMTADDCEALPPGLGLPDFEAPCWPDDSLSISYTIASEFGDWDTAGVGFIPSDLEFPVGTNTVWYIVTDPDGNKDSCDFTVTMLQDDISWQVYNCPPSSVSYTLGPTECEVALTLPPPTFNDHCITASYTVTNDFNGDSVINNEIFPVGTTEVIWTITDNSGNDTTCTVIVEVDGIQLPSITCPPSVSGTMTADDCEALPPGLGLPDFEAPCWPDDSLSISYTIASEFGDWDTAGVGFIPSDLEFPVGTNTVWYIVTDPDGNKDSCDFTVTMLQDDISWQVYNCPPSSVSYTLGPTECEVALTLPPPTFNDHCITASYTVTNDFNGDSVINNEIFPVGTTEVIWTITDNSGNDTTCTVIVEVDGIQLPSITCPPSVTGGMTADECEALPPVLDLPDFEAPCWPDDSLSISYTIASEFGDWDTAGLGFIPSDLEFPVGTNTVWYTVTDPDGNKDSCSFTVTMQQDEIPWTAYTCPPNPADATVDSFSCEAWIDIDPPTINDHCLTATYSMNHDSPYAAGTDSTDASGNYPIGVHTVTWTISDNSGNDTTCIQTFEVFDLEPRLVCPPDVEVFADENELFATGVTVGLPYYWDNCDSVLTYTVTTPDSITTLYNGSSDSINLLDYADTYDLGVTTIEYTFRDGNGHELVCEFTVTVLAAPDIECPPDTTIWLDGSEANCDVTFDPGVADLIEGAPPITWTYTIHFADGTTEGPVTYIKDASDPYANPLGDRTFPLGVTTIEWRAENDAGFDTCSHWVEVIDTIPPQFTVDPYENCVDPLHWATYDPANANPVINHIDPLLNKFPVDFRTLPLGDTSLDLLTLDDNCCDSVDMTINWRIEFTPTPNPLVAAPDITYSDITGTGQPSLYGSDILLPGDGVYFNDVVHHIFYWVEDCNGNTTPEVMREITITPRPQIIKQN
uniref:HYR domain-containing protein n=1 Tax=uncultured Draconibacterium sp. TaxID=1573823 RepID=UPI00321642D8